MAQLLSAEDITRLSGLPVVEDIPANFYTVLSDREIRSETTALSYPQQLSSTNFFKATVIKKQLTAYDVPVPWYNYYFEAEIPEGAIWLLRNSVKIDTLSQFLSAMKSLVQIAKELTSLQIKMPLTPEYLWWYQNRIMGNAAAILNIFKQDQTDIGLWWLASEDMVPETVNIEKRYVYGIGLFGYYLLNGEGGYGWYSASTGKIMKRGMELSDKISPAIAYMLGRCTRDDPKERFTLDNIMTCITDISNNISKLYM